MKKLGEAMKRDDNTGYTVAVLIALLFVTVLLVAYYPVLKPPAKETTTIYLLDSQKKALNYTERLIVDQNNTFTVWVGVENHMGKNQNCEVLLKMTTDPISSLPFEADAENRYLRTLENGEIWETLVEVTINELGRYYVIFELWIYDETGVLEFTNNFSVLGIEVVAQL